MAPEVRRNLAAFLQGEVYAVLSSVASNGTPQSALVGVVVNDRFEVFFDTLASSRKATNLRSAPAIAFVFGSTDSTSIRTVQYEGTADEPSGDELDELLERYFDRFPDGGERRSAGGIAYFRAKPAWIRFSDYSVAPPLIAEFRESDLV